MGAWTVREVQRLYRLREQGLAAKEIAAKLKRSVIAVESKIKRDRRNAKNNNANRISASHTDAFGILQDGGVTPRLTTQDGNGAAITDATGVYSRLTQTDRNNVAQASRSIINPNKRIAARIGETAIVISDVQAPWQDNDALDLALAIAKDVKPTRIIFLGDIWDVSGASGWRKNPFIPLLFNEERRITRAIYEIWCEEFPRCRKDAVAGNHEERIAWGLQSLPERHRWISQVSDLDWASLLGLDCETVMAPTLGLDMQEELARINKDLKTDNDLSAQDVVMEAMNLMSKRKPKKFPSLGIQVIRREPAAYELPTRPFISHDVLKIGKLRLTHGHEFKMNCLSVHVAVNVLRKTKSNIVIGHWHRVGPAIDKNLEGHDIGAFLNPCLCRLDQYAFRPAWQQGISIVDFTHSGYFCVQPAVFMHDDGLGTFSVFGRKAFTVQEAPKRFRKLPPIGMLAQMLPIPPPQEML